MKIQNLEIPDLKLITPSIYRDDRGYFMESFNQRVIQSQIKIRNFIQDNESSSSFGVLRGLHFQLPPFTETKLVRVITGSVFDVFLDIRKDSPTFGKWGSYILNADNPEWISLPKGIAHGMITLEENMIMQYKVDSCFEPKSDSQIKWDDPDLAIEWPIKPVIISEKDKNAPSFKKFLENNGGLII